MALLIENSFPIKKGLFVLLSFILALVIGFVPFVEYPLSMSRTFVYGFFFFLGWFLRGNNKKNELYKE